MLGGLIALCSAATFALNNTTVRRGVLTGSVVQAMAITVPIGLPISLLMVLVTNSMGAVFGFSSKALLALSASGILHFVWGRYCNYRATRAIGTNLVAPIQQVNLIFTLCLAIWLLGEQLTPLRIIGIALVLAGPSISLREHKPSPGEREVSAEKITAIDAEKPVAFKPRYGEGILFALLSATGYGFSPILVRVGLEGKGLAVSIAGNFVAAVASTAVMGLILLWPGRLREALAVNRESAKWFTFSGILVCFSQIFLYMAMSIAPVTVVSPINRMSILFRLHFSRWINPEHEMFGGNIVLGTFVSLAGALLLSASTETVESLLPWPDAIRTLLQWHWPS